MLKSFIYFFVLNLLLNGKSVAQDYYFEKTFSFNGFSHNSGNASVYFPNDSSYLIMSQLYDCGLCPVSIGFIKINSVGDTLWSHVFNSGNPEFQPHHMYYNGQEYLVIASYISNETYLSLLRFDTTGSFISANDYSMGIDGYFGLATLEDDTIYAFGNIFSGGSQFMIMYKFNLQGDTLLSKLYGDGTIIFNPFATTSINDSTLVLLCETELFPGNWIKQFIYINHELDTIFTITIPSSESEHYSFLYFDTLTEMYSLIGHVDTTTGKDFSFRSFDINHQPLNFNVWGTPGNDFISNCIRWDTDFIVTGGSNYVVNTSGNLFVMRLSDSGAVINVQNHGYQFLSSGGGHIINLSETGFFVTGTAVPTVTSSVIYYLKTDTNGIITDIPLNLTPDQLISVVRSGDELIFTVFEGRIIKSIICHDSLGRNVAVTIDHTSLSISGYPSGLYLVSVILNTGERATIRIII